jgi:hypothetical protein
LDEIRVEVEDVIVLLLVLCNSDLWWAFALCQLEGRDLIPDLWRMLAGEHLMEGAIFSPDTISMEDACERALERYLR